MTTDPAPRWPWLSRAPRRALAGVIAALAILCAVFAAISWGVASANDDELTGRGVTSTQLTAIKAAARSCPMLTPARIAGQLMAESGLNSRSPETASGGEGIAGLDDTDWKAWKPWPDAQRSDISANILALAHQMCDISGQLRVAKIPGDQWRLSAAAYHSGLATVVAANAVPATSLEYVDLASGYAAYYGGLRTFGGTGAQGPDRPDPTAADDAKAVPDVYVPLVVEAGSTCEQMTPAAVAAQLMALSGFDPNHLGAAGQRGVAQFRDDVWQEYAPEGASAWDATVAIPTLGTAMCAMITELSALDGDSYLLALAAYRNGPSSLRQGDGTVDPETESFVKVVKEFTDFYALDGRLGTAKPSPSPSPSPVQPTTGPSAPAPVPTTAPPPPAEPPPAEQPTRPTGATQIYHPASGLCVSSGSRGDGTRLTLQECAEVPAQWWVFRDDGTIRSQGLCMDIAWGVTDNDAAIQVARCSGNPAQGWVVNSKGAIVSTLDGTKGVDVDLNAADKPLRLWFYVESGHLPWQTWQQR